jgi:lysozyme family protein
MADFVQAYEKTIRAEGGYVLHNVPGDRGGMTYAGIARRYHPNWPGWAHIDAGSEPPAELVREFYRERFWGRIRGDEIASQAIAETIYDFAVNAGVKTASILAQVVASKITGEMLTPDGVVGPKTLAALNQCDERLFVALYTIAKIARYCEIVRRDRSQVKFLLGWITRAIKGAA